MQGKIKNLLVIYVVHDELGGQCKWVFTESKQKQIADKETNTQTNLFSRINHILWIQIRIPSIRIHISAQMNKEGVLSYTNLHAQLHGMIVPEWNLPGGQLPEQHGVAPHVRGPRVQLRHRLHQRL